MTGAEITASYDNGIPVDVSVTPGMVGGYDAGSVGTQKLNVNYGGKTTAFTVTVNTKTLTGIVMKSPPNKTIYMDGQSLDVTGAVITASYDNGIPVNLTVTSGMVGGYNAGSVGTQTLTVTYGGKTTTFKVTVILPASPTSLKAVSASYNSVKLTWAAVTGAKGYGVYRSTSANGPYTLITNAATNSYTNTGLTAGTTYYYKVNAYATVGTAKVYGSQTAAVSARPVPATPAGLTAVSAAYNSVKLTWAAVTGAKGYEVYRSTSATGTYTLITNAATNSYTNTGLTAGTTYYYKINAYATVGTAKVYGSQTAAVSARPVPVTMATIGVARYSSSSIRIGWRAISGASGYEIYRATSSTGMYSLIKTTTAIYIINTGLTTGKYYYYKVRAYRLVGTTKIYGGFSSVRYAKP